MNTMPWSPIDGQPEIAATDIAETYMCHRKEIWRAYEKKLWKKMLKKTQGFLSNVLLTKQRDASFKVQSIWI